MLRFKIIIWLQLQKVTVPIVAQATCRSSYQGVNTVTIEWFALSWWKGTCQGDSGGKSEWDYYKIILRQF